MSDQKPLVLNDSLKDSIDHTVGNALNSSVNQEKDSTSSIIKEVEIESPGLAKTKRKFTIVQVCGSICLLIALLLIFALPPLIQNIIIEQAKQQVIMTSSNEGLWGHFPGDTNTIILRNFTFFKLDNQFQFLFHNQKPAFKEFAGYKIQQLQDFLDIQYLDDGNLVKVRDWVRFKEWAQSKSLDSKVQILNMGNLGYWSTLKAARPTLLLQQGLALLFTNIQSSLVPTLLGSGINQQYLKDEPTLFKNLLSPAGIPAQSTHFIWSDAAYGMGDKQNLGLWATAAINCFENQKKIFSFSNDSMILKNYFGFNDGQLLSVMNKIYTYVTSLRKILLENHYCAQIPMSQCTGRYLGIAQLADGWVTGNTPPVSTISPNDTICDDNITCKGLYPEPNAYIKNIFKISDQMGKSLGYDATADYNFDRTTVLRWFNYDDSIQQGLDYNTAQDCLLHIGNLDALWEMGLKFEENFDVTLLDPIIKRFGVKSRTQALIFWQWIRYITDVFVLQRAGNANLGMSNLFTAGFYQQFSYLQDNLQRFLLSKMVQKDLQGIQCHQFFKKALDEYDNILLINSLCHEYTDIHSYDFAQFMVDTCEKRDGNQWNELVDLGVGLILLENLCDAQGQGNIGNQVHQYKLKFKDNYGCRVTTTPYCSNYQLALLQWQKSVVTLSPPIQLSKELISSTSFNSWDPKAKKIEYSHFISLFPQAQRQKFPQFTLDDLFKKFTFEGWFSTNLVLKSLAAKEVDPYFYKYLRYVCIYITLNGYTTSRTVRQFLFGYEDQFLKTVKDGYPPFGGDPSAPSEIAFNDLNFTKQQANIQIVFKTGKNDFREVYQNYQINGYRYLVNNYTWFDGNKTVWAWKSPWAEDDYFFGTTAKIFAPDQFEADNLSLLIPQVQRYGSNSFKRQTFQTERYGMDLYISYLNAKIGEVSPQNDKYYQTLPNVFNVTSIYGLPLFITKNHFMNCTQWLGKVDIYNEDKSTKYQQISKWDDTFILVEPYTGVSFQSQIYLQNNYYHQKDPLYDYPSDVFLPIFSISRSGNLTEDKFHQLYDPLVTAFTVKSAVVYIGIAIAVICVALIAFATFKKRKLGKNPELKTSQLGISMQEVTQSAIQKEK